jgi:phage N-6-adenine-methyltransferase
MNPGLFSSELPNWGTPQFLFDELHSEFGFTLDACADSTNKKCQIYFDKETDALSKSWHGRVWMNPPYGRGIGDWVKHAYEQVQCGNAEIVAALVPMRSETKWFQDYGMKAAEMRLLNKRLTFETPPGAESTLKGHNAPFPSVLLIFDARSTNPIVSSYDVIGLERRAA